MGPCRDLWCGLSKSGARGTDTPHANVWRGALQGTYTSALIPPPPSLNGDAVSVRVLSLTSQCSTFTNDLFCRTASSQLIRGLPSPSYGAFRPNKGLPFHRPGQGSSRYAAPGPPPPTSTHFPELLSDLFPGSPKPPTTRWERPPIQPSTQGLSRPINTRIPSEPTRGLSERKTSRYCQGVTFWLVIIMVIQAVLIVCRSNTVAKFVNLEFTARRASRGGSALLAGREKSEQERAKMERERKLWEKVPEDHIPPGAYWKSIGPAYNCQAYGKREYQGMLQDIPRGWTAMDACMNTPANIEGVTIRRPDRCAFVSGSPHIHGYWTVNWNQKDCKPWLKDIRDIVSLIFAFVPASRPHSHLAGVYEL